MIYTQTRTTREGFTLIELVVVIAIIGILMVTVGPNLYRYIAGAGKTATMSNLRTIKVAIDQFKLDFGEFPEKLRDLVKKPSDEKFKKWEESYLNTNEVPQDGWKHPFYYKKPGEKGHPYELSSYGPNGKGSPKNEWISVWDL